MLIHLSFCLSFIVFVPSNPSFIHLLIDLVFFLSFYSFIHSFIFFIRFRLQFLPALLSFRFFLPRADKLSRLEIQNQWETWNSNLFVEFDSSFHSFKPNHLHLESICAFVSLSVELKILGEGIFFSLWMITGGIRMEHRRVFGANFKMY